MIPVEHAHLYISAATHPGMKGKPNEDRYSVLAYRFTSDERTPSVLAVLADGIGGHRAGEVAAELALENIHHYITDNSSGQPVQVLDDAFRYANQEILNHSRDSLPLAGMGTTCVCAWVVGDQLYAASVGDSRLYLQRGRSIFRLTTDHTWIQDALSEGVLNPDQVRGHPNAHIIRRFLGSVNTVVPDMRLRLSASESDARAEANQGLHLLPGDRLLMCTDGLTDLVKDAEILDILRTTELEQTPGHLIDLANQRGGHDNITVVALEVPQPEEITRPLHVSTSPLSIPAGAAVRPAFPWLMMILVLAAILIMVLLLLYTYLSV